MRHSLRFVKSAFDDTEEGLRLQALLPRLVFFGLAIYLLVWILRPDLFGLVPNSLDPMFYTGYAVNLDDALNAAGNRHYFVTRWTSYMPMYLFSEVFGPYWGRLVLRLIMLLVLAETLWRLGHRMALPTKSRLLGIFVVLTAPMFVRAFTTDYPEYLIIWGSMMILSLVIMNASGPTFIGSMSIGVLSGFILLANPFTTVLLGISIGIGVLYWRSGGAHGRRVTLSLSIQAASVLSVVIFGFVLFKYGYRIGNILEPTIKFIQNNQRPAVDGWVAPNRQWSKHFSWLYIPPLVVFVSLCIPRAKKQGSLLATRALQTITILTYLAHVGIQFSQGHALETSFYWSMSLGPVLMLSFLTLGILSRDAPKLMALSTAVVFLVLVGYRIPQVHNLGAGYALFVALGIMGIAVVIAVRTMPAFASFLLVVVMTWMQIGAPEYLVRTNGGDLNSPRYDLVYQDNAIQSQLIQSETLWFLSVMDEIRDDWKATFLTAGGWSAAIVGTYIPHPFSRWLVPESETRTLTSNVRDELIFNRRPLLVIFGDASIVEQYLMRTKLELPNSVVLLDRTHSEGLGYRLVALQGNAGPRGETLIPAARLYREIGRPQIDGSVVAGRNEGFVTFGPYFGLGEGTYSATIVFESEFKGVIGQFEVVDDKNGSSTKVPLIADGSGQQEASIHFLVESSSETWQLRTFHNGSQAVLYHHFILRKNS